MAELTFKKLANEVEELVKIYTHNHWPYHAEAHPTEDIIRQRFEEGWFHNNRETFWVEENDEKIGFLIIENLSSHVPKLYDIRLIKDVQGKGYGEECINWMTNYIFNESQDHRRIETYTRSDNFPMRKVLHKCLFQKEGYLRNSWENDDGSITDCLIYAIIRKDWENDRVTPIRMHNFPY